MLKLIQKNSQPLYQGNSFQMIENKITVPKGSAQTSFIWDFQEISSGIYIARFQDVLHRLTCEITLELKDTFNPSEHENEDIYLEPVIVGNYPSIGTQQLQQEVFWDEYLHGMILIQFQLKILEQLLLFCEGKDTAYIYLTFNEVNQDYLEIYQRFIISKQDILSSHEVKIEISISTDVSVYDELIDFMEEVDHSFRKTLWREQRVESILSTLLKI